MSRFVKKRLSKQLAKYLEFPSKKFKISFFKGEGKLENICTVMLKCATETSTNCIGVAIKKDVLHEVLHLPANVLVSSAVCNKARTKVLKKLGDALYY